MDKPQVDYELKVYDELPPSLRGGGGGRSILNEQLDKIIENKDLHGRPVRIGLYTKGTAATAAKNVLQQRNGRNASVKGWKFYTRPVPVSEEPDADVLRGLFAVYTPDVIIEGALQAHEAAERARKQKLAEQREARENSAVEHGTDPEDEGEDDEEDDLGDEDEDEDDEDEG